MLDYAEGVLDYRERWKCLRISDFPIFRCNGDALAAARMKELQRDEDARAPPPEIRMQDQDQQEGLCVWAAEAAGDRPRRPARWARQEEQDRGRGRAEGPER